MSVKRPNIKEELRNFAVVLDKISRFRLDKAEYDYLKSTLLFRTGKYFNNTKKNNKERKQVINMPLMSTITHELKYDMPSLQTFWIHPGRISNLFKKQY